MKIRTCSSLLLISLLIGCASTLHYTGKSYPTTTKIDIFISAKEIKKPYEVMGTVDAKMSQFADFNELMDKLNKEARKQGADAVLILGLKDEEIKKDSLSGDQGGALNNQQLIGGSKLVFRTPANKLYNELNGQFLKYK